MLKWRATRRLEVRKLLAICSSLVLRGLMTMASIHFGFAAVDFVGAYRAEGGEADHLDEGVEEVGGHDGDGFGLGVGIATVLHGAVGISEEVEADELGVAAFAAFDDGFKGRIVFAARERRHAHGDGFPATDVVSTDGDDAQVEFLAVEPLTDLVDSGGIGGPTGVSGAGPQWF